MPNHDHHHCDCKHTDLSFCKKCDLVYCKGCNREWQNPCTLSHYNWYTAPTYTVPTVTPQIDYTTWAGDSACDHNSVFVATADGVHKIGG